MASEALGLLECKGLVSLMEGCDAMLKSANVEMIGWDKAGSGMVTAETVQLFVIGLPAVLLGMWLGLRLYGKLNEAAFRTVVLVLLLISGLSLLPSAIMSTN